MLTLKYHSFTIIFLHLNGCHCERREVIQNGGAVRVFLDCFVVKSTPRKDGLSGWLVCCISLN